MKGSVARENGYKQAPRRVTAIPTTTMSTANTAPDLDIIFSALAHALSNKDSHLTGHTVALPEFSDDTLTNVTHAVLSMGGIQDSANTVSQLEKRFGKEKFSHDLRSFTRIVPPEQQDLLFNPSPEGSQLLQSVIYIATSRFLHGLKKELTETEGNDNCLQNWHIDESDVPFEHLAQIQSVIESDPGLVSFRKKFSETDTGSENQTKKSSTKEGTEVFDYGFQKKAMEKAFAGL